MKTVQTAVNLASVAHSMRSCYQLPSVAHNVVKSITQADRYVAQYAVL